MVRVLNEALPKVRVETNCRNKLAQLCIEGIICRTSVQPIMMTELEYAWELKFK